MILGLDVGSAVVDGLRDAIAVPAVVYALASVASEPYPDPRAPGEKLLAVDLKAMHLLPRAVPLKELKRSNKQFGIASLCIGGGQGGAIVVERGA